jgi:hypothetical protein
MQLILAKFFYFLVIKYANAGVGHILKLGTITVRYCSMVSYIYLVVLPHGRSVGIWQSPVLVLKSSGISTNFSFGTQVLGCLWTSTSPRPSYPSCSSPAGPQMHPQGLL